MYKTDLYYKWLYFGYSHLFTVLYLLYIYTKLITRISSTLKSFIQLLEYLCFLSSFYILHLKFTGIRLLL